MSAMTASATRPPATSSGLRLRPPVSSGEAVLAGGRLVDVGAVSVGGFSCDAGGDPVSFWFGGGGVVYQSVSAPVFDLRLVILPTGVPNASM